MSKAIILFSGGIDSTVILALALARGLICHALSFNYGQKHIKELESAQRVAAYYGVTHQLIHIDIQTFRMAARERSSLVSNLEAPRNRSLNEIASQGIPNTYVPARNTLFLSYALAICEINDAQEIHLGANQMDFSCYPDCRPDYMQAFQQVINLATQQAIERAPPKLVTPLIKMNKTAIIRQGLLLKAPLEMTWSCYNPTSTEEPCQVCDACLLRKGEMP